MKILTGTDIIEIKRVQEYIDLNKGFINRVYTEREIEYCESKNKQKYQHYAARFAAKEATFKAVSELLKNKYDISWKNIEIINDISNKPKIQFLDIELNNIQDIDISISHCKEYAVSNVVILTK